MSHDLIFLHNKEIVLHFFFAWASPPGDGGIPLVLFFLGGEAINSDFLKKTFWISENFQIFNIFKIKWENI